MKKLLTLICALFVVAGASAQSPSASLKIGSMCTINGRQCIIFALSSDRQHGKALCVDQTHDDWVDAEAWCMALGEGWSLPSKSDFNKLHLVLNKINEVLSHNDLKLFDSATYWSKESIDEYFAHAYYVCVSYVSEFSLNKYNNQCKVCAVYSF